MNKKLPPKRAENHLSKFREFFHFIHYPRFKIYWDDDAYIEYCKLCGKWTSSGVEFHEPIEIPPGKTYTFDISLGELED